MNLTVSATKWCLYLWFVYMMIKSIYNTIISSALSIFLWTVLTIPLIVLPTLGRRIVDRYLEICNVIEWIPLTLPHTIIFVFFGRLYNSLGYELWYRLQFIFLCFSYNCKEISKPFCVMCTSGISSRFQVGIFCSQKHCISTCPLAG